MNRFEVVVLAECLACFERGTECRVIDRHRDGSTLVVEFDEPRGLLKVARDQIRPRNHVTS